MSGNGTFALSLLLKQLFDLGAFLGAGGSGIGSVLLTCFSGAATSQTVTALLCWTQARPSENLLTSDGLLALFASTADFEGSPTC